MKILLTSLSGQLGGLELRLLDEARWLMKLGHQAELAINPFSEIDSWVESLYEEGVPFSFFAPPPFFEEWRWRRFNKLRAYLFYRNFYKQKKVDLVHVAFAWTETGGTRLWLAHCANIPAVISVHNAFPYLNFTPWHEKILIEAFQSVKGIYAVSDSALDKFVQIYSKFFSPNILLKVIYNPIDVSKFKPSCRYRNNVRAKMGFSVDNFVMGVVGRLDKQKRPEMLIEVFSILKKRFSNLKLIFIGQGNLENQCRQRVNQLKLKDSVYFMGFQRNVEQLLPALDLHILLSQREGFGIATAEAMACGVPVVATNVPGSRDILANSQAGLLVPPDNIDQIVIELCDLILNTYKLRSMSQAGPSEVSQRFAKPLIEKQIKEFYESI